MSEHERPGSLAEALILLQARLPRITKDEHAEVETKTGGKYGYSYTTLASIHDAIFPLLAEVGLYWTCCPTLDETRFVLDYCLWHVSGERIQGIYPLPESGGSQALGSAITYARRYALTAVLGIAPVEDDDDGQRAQAAHDSAPAEQAHEWRPPANPRTRKAQRARGTADETTDWTTGPPEDAPGSSTEDQHRSMAMLFQKAGLHAADARHAATARIIGADEVESSKDLSYTQAALVIRELQSIIKAEQMEARGRT